MKTPKEHHLLLAKLEEAARKYQGMWSAFTHAGHHGLASFAAYEAKERLKYAEQVAQHLAEHGEHVQYGALPAPACDYKTPAAAMDAACKMEDEVATVAAATHQAVVQAGERPYFLGELVSKLDRDRKEVAEVKSLLGKASAPDQIKAINLSLLKKYSGHA